MKINLITANIYPNKNGYYKRENSTFFNKDEKCINIALYDDIRMSEAFGRYFGSNNLRSTEIACPDMTDRQLERVKRALEKMGIKENTLYEPLINEKGEYTQKFKKEN